MFQFHDEEYQKNVLQIYNHGKVDVKVQISRISRGFTFYFVELISNRIQQRYDFTNVHDLYNILNRTGYLHSGSYCLLQNEGTVQVLHKMSTPKEEKDVFMTALFYLKHINMLMLLYCLSKKKCNIFMF